MRVLVIEDEQKIANALKKALMIEKYAVDVSYDSDDGFGMASSEAYDLMIIDRMLPGDLDGIEIIKKLRELKITTPILLLTALGSTTDKTTGLDSGADDYMVKPFSLEELLARVRALLRRPKKMQNIVLKIGDLILDTNNQVVSRANKKIELTNKEYGLLEYLMRNPNRPISKDKIIAHVWDFDADILPNTVEVYIKYLRKKIDAPFQKPLLHTVRGFGYKIQDE